MIEDHRGNLWVGTDGGGLNYLDRRTGRFTYYRNDPRDPTSLGLDSVVSLLEDRAHNIWLGTWTADLHRLDPRTGRFTRFPRDPQLPQSFAEWTLVEDRDGKLLVGLRDAGVEIFDPDTGAYTRLSDLYPGAGESGQVYAIAIDAQNDLWIGSAAALEYVNRRSGEVRRWPIDPTDPATPVPGSSSRRRWRSWPAREASRTSS